MSISDSGNPGSTIVIRDDQQITPYSNIIIEDTGYSDQAHINWYGGTLSDPNLGTDSVTQSGASFTTPYGSDVDTQSIMRRLVFTPTKLGPAQSSNASVDGYVYGSTYTYDDYQFKVLTDPRINGTTAGQEGKVGEAIRPFSTVTIKDDNSVTVGISVDASAGKLTGDGLTDLGNGNYSITAADPFTVQTQLRNVNFTPSDAASGKTVSFALAVLSKDTPTFETTPFQATDGNTSVNVAKIDDHSDGGSAAPDPSHCLITDVSTGIASVSDGEPYNGPVAKLTWQYLNTTEDKLAVLALKPNAFIHTGSGDDAVQVNSGTNVIDGSTGSNFLTAGSGYDTFYVDDRNATSDIWSTIIGAKPGDDITVWGLTKEDFNVTWTDTEGAPNAKGLTMHATGAGKPEASLTVTGFTTADLNNGKISTSYGTSPNTTGLPGSQYMNIHINS